MQAIPICAMLPPISQAIALQGAAQSLMRPFSALITALLLSATTPARLLGTCLFANTLLASPAPAHAESAEAVAKVAQTITVRIEGATQGSGVLVKRDTNRYTVMTAWHVVEGQRLGEELDIYTPDGQRYPVEQGSIRRIGKLDAAEIKFTSSKDYIVAIANSCPTTQGATLFVAGYPIDMGGLVINKSSLTAQDIVDTSLGQALVYELASSNGMSGGPILSASGCFIGMHLGKSAFQDRNMPFRLSRGLRVTAATFDPSTLASPIEDPYFTASCPVLGSFAIYVVTSSRNEQPVIRGNHYLVHPATLATINGSYSGLAEIYHGGDVFFSTIDPIQGRPGNPSAPLDASFDRNLNEHLDEYPQDVKVSQGGQVERCISLFRSF